MVDTAVSFLLENLANFVSDYVHLIRNAKEELSGLEKELKRMKAHMEDASKKENPEEHFKESMRQMREVIYEVEDTIDSYVLKPDSFNLKSKIKELRENVKQVLDLAKEELSKHANAIGIFHIAGVQETKSTRIKAPREENVVGLEEQTDTLIKSIKEDKGFDVFSIVGMPGLGKTTLAWKIYRDPRIHYEFPTLIWVYFSQDYNMRNVLLTILKKFTQNIDMSNNTNEELTELVQGHLERGKFLIFIDDVWTIDAWRQIERLLRRSNEMGRVLMTTRQADVAKFASRPREPHQLEFLSTEKSLELLRIEIYTDQGFPPAFETLAKNIAEKCGGLPLAIIVIGGMLAGKSSAREWRRISEDVGGYLSEKDREENLEKIISLSYKNLPYNLRDCFLYLGMFPGEKEISALKLTQLWIAEGFIRKTQGESLEVTAEDNLKELINRNLVMVEKRKINGEVKTCNVHDTIREFCQKKAGVTEQNLFQEISRPMSTGPFEPSNSVIEQCRRLSIHTHVKEFFLKKQKLPILRSFLCTSKEPIILEKRDISLIKPEHFELIRVLDVSPIKFPSFPSKFNKLLHLRYLTLSCTELVKLLPEAMGKLCNMQTLTVNTTQRTLEVKANIWDMLQLRHFKTKASIILINDGKGEGGENLQTLSRLSTVSCTSTVFDKATNLKTLGICGELSTIMDFKCLENLESLEKLKLVNEVYLKPASEISLKRFPRRLPLNIKSLTLSATNLDWGQMSAVGKFSKLEVLKLKNNAFVGNAWDAVSGDFQQLEFLYISQTNLKVWTASDGSFPKLRSIILKNCWNLQGVPNNLELENLEILNMERVTSFAARSGRNIEKRKQEAEGNQKAKKGKFKLTIYPVDES